MAVATTYRKEYYQRNKKVAKERARVRAANQYTMLKEKIDAIKVEKGCARCMIDNPVVLTFHHRDPATKSDTISNLMRRRNWALIKAEIDKCDVLCFNCHAIVEQEIRNG